MSIVTSGTIGRLLQPLRRASQLRRTRGNARAGYAILRRLVSFPLARNCLHFCAVDYWRLPLTTVGENPRTSPRFTVRFAQPDDIADLADYFDDQERVEKRWAQGDRCVVAISQGSIGAAVWLALGPGQFLEDWDDLRCAFRFPAGIAWSYDGKGTKMGAWGTMMRQLPTLLSDENIQEVATIIDCNNWLSMDGHRSLGYLSAGVVLHARLLGFTTRLFKPMQQRWQRVPLSIADVEIIKKRPSDA